MISLLPITNDDRRRVLSLGANVPQYTTELVAAPIGVRVALQQLDGQFRRHEQGGSSRRRGAKRSAPPEVPVEELTIRESDCLPYEYEGPPMATMGGGGGCVVA